MTPSTPTSFIIFDLDGTVADSRHRSHHIRVGLGSKLVDHHGDHAVVVTVDENHEDYEGETAFNLQYLSGDLEGHTLWWGRSSVEPWRTVDWDAWDAGTPDDTPIDPVISVLKGLRERLSHHTKIMFLTARGERARRLTEEWLKRHDIWEEGDVLVMRCDGDTRLDTVIKRDIIRQLKASGHEILFAFEDRRLVANMMREEGIFVFHVADYD